MSQEWLRLSNVKRVSFWRVNREEGKGQCLHEAQGQQSTISGRISEMRRILMVKTIGEAGETRIQDVREKTLGWRDGLTVKRWAVLPEAPDSIPSTHTASFTALCNSSPQGSDVAWPPLCCTCVVNRCACR
jgi:hypothetical protein